MDSIYTFENDTGPDDANHDYNGLFVLADPRISASEQGRKVEDISLYDIAPTILDCLNTKAPSDMLGRNIFDKDRPAG